MFAKGTLSSIAILSVVVLSACKGQDFTRESNPVKDYGTVLQDSRPYSTDQRQREQQQIESEKQKPCGVPFTTTIEGEPALSSIFKEGQEKSITVHVDSQLDPGTQWDVKELDGFPANSTFKSVSKTDKSAVYKFTWKPAKGSADSVDGNFLTLRYVWAVEARCTALPIKATITLVVRNNDSTPVVSTPSQPVVSSPGAPVISFPGLPTDTVKFGSPAIKFQIQVIDPAATEGAAPELAPITLKEKPGFLSANQAIDCAATGRSVQTSDGQNASVFDCSFDSSLFSTNAAFKSLSGSGKTISAVLAVKATSTASKTVTKARATIKVLFEKIATKKVQGAQS